MVMDDAEKCASTCAAACCAACCVRSWMSAVGGLVCGDTVGGCYEVAILCMDIKAGATAKNRPAPVPNTHEFNVCAVVVDAAVYGRNGGSCKW